MAYTLVVQWPGRREESVWGSQSATCQWLLALESQSNISG